MHISGRNCGLEAGGEPGAALGGHILGPGVPNPGTAVSLMVSFGHMRRPQAQLSNNFPFEQLKGKSLSLAARNQGPGESRRW